MKLRTSLIGFVILGTTLVAPLVAFAAPCPQGVRPPNGSNECVRIDNTLGSGYTIIGNTSEQRGSYPPGTPVRFSYNEQGQLTQTSIGDRGEPLPAVSAPPATRGECTPAQLRDGYGRYVRSDGFVVCARSNADADALSRSDSLSNIFGSSNPSETNVQAWDACKNASLIGVDGAVTSRICYAFAYIIYSIFSIKNFFYLASFIAYLVLMVAQVFLAYGVWWLDGAIYYTMVLMGAYINSDVAREGIYTAWAAIRDIANIFIIAGFVVIGISTILQVAQYSAEKLLSRLIIAALLVNFSYFFAGAIIDATNYVGTQIYYSDFMEDGCDGEAPQRNVVSGIGSLLFTGGSVLIGDKSSICSIGASFMKYTNVTSWDDIRQVSRTLSGLGAGPTGVSFFESIATSGEVANAARVQNTSPDVIYRNLYWHLTVLSIMGALFAALTGFVFISAALAFIVRFAALILALILSPIGIAGSAVPYLDKYAAQWWTLVTSQAIFAPVFIILAAIALRVTKSLMEFLKTDGKTFADTVNAATRQAGQGWLTDSAPLFIVYFVGIALMWLALMISRQLASSVPELKVLYDAAGKYAMNAYLAPVRFPQQIALGDRGLGGLARYGLESWAATRDPQGMTAKVLTSLSTGTRFLGQVGQKKKEGQKSASDTTRENVEGLRKGRFGPDKDVYLKGWWKRSANPFAGAKSWSLRKKDAVAVLDRDPKTWSDEEKDNLKNLVQSIDKDNIHNELTPSQIQTGLKHGLFTKEQQEAIFKSGTFSPKQVAGFRAALLDDFNTAEKNAKDQNHQGTYADVSKAYEDLSQVAREQLRVSRSDLKIDEQFLGALKNKDFEEFVKDMSADERKAARDARQRGHAEELKKAAKETDKAERDKRMRAVLNRMSDDEKKDMTPDMVREALPHLTVNEMLHLHRNGSKEVKQILEADTDANKEIQRGSGPGVLGRTTSASSKDAPSIPPENPELRPPPAPPVTPHTTPPTPENPRGPIFDGGGPRPESGIYTPPSEPPPNTPPAV